MAVCDVHLTSRQRRRSAVFQLLQLSDTGVPSAGATFRAVSESAENVAVARWFLEMNCVTERRQDAEASYLAPEHEMTLL